MVARPTLIDPTLVAELEACAGEGDDVISVAKGRTMATDCFYEGQARLDGAICEYVVSLSSTDIIICLAYCRS
jgi:uridine phosphorylase